MQIHVAEIPQICWLEDSICLYLFFNHTDNHGSKALSSYIYPALEIIQQLAQRSAHSLRFRFDAVDAGAGAAAGSMMF